MPYTCLSTKMTESNPETPTILVVDDELEALKAMAQLLERRGGYRTLIAASGEQAMEVMAANKVDIVITDLRMPGMDGLEVLRRINTEYPAVDVIISTAYASVDSAVDALRKGATDYLQKPNKPKEMLEKVREILERRTKTKRREAELEAVRKRDVTRESELRKAGAIQQRWIPQGYQGRHISLVTGYQSAEELSGDFMDVVELDERRLGFVVGDVVGHGLPASLQTGIVQRLIKKEMLDGKSAAQAFTSINSFLYDEYHMDSAFTAFAGVFDGEEYVLRYAIGGHPPPIQVTPEGKCSFLETSCPGLLVVPSHEYVEHVLALYPGDRLCIYTDGVVETRNSGGDLFSETRLATSLLKHAKRPLSGLIAAIEDDVREFRADAPIIDDFSLMLVEII